MTAKILYICGTFVPAAGGAEVSAHALLRKLQSGYQIAVVTGNSANGGIPKCDGSSMSVWYAAHTERLKICEETIRRFRPDVILTQLLWSDVAMALGAKHRIPTIVRICKVPFGKDYLQRHPPRQTIAISPFVSRYLQAEHGISSVEIPPLVDFGEVCAPKALRHRAPYITTFNPVRLKGGDLFKRIAERAPQRRFGWVRGWDILRTNGTFDNERCRAISESLSIPFSGGIPVDEDFSSLPNVHRIDCAFPPAPIYRCSRIVLIPSRWPEAFGRVAIEAMANRIPVLGTNVGGLGEIVQGGGIALPLDDPDAWLHAINTLDESDTYENAAEIGWRFLQSFYNPEKIVAATKAAIENVLLDSSNFQ